MLAYYSWLVNLCETICRCLLKQQTFIRLFHVVLDTIASRGERLELLVDKTTELSENVSSYNSFNAIVFFLSNNVILLFAV